MTTRQLIALAVANGCSNTRQIAVYIHKSHSCICTYFFDSCPRPPAKFQNGDVLQWDQGKSNTIRLGPNAVVVKKAGRVVDVMRGEVVKGRMVLRYYNVDKSGKI